MDLLQIREELEGYETKVKLFKVPARYKANLESDMKIFKRLKQEGIFNAGFASIKDYDAARVNELSVSEIISLIRHFPKYAAAAKENDASFQFRECLIEKLVEIIEKANQLNPNITDLNTISGSVTIDTLDDIKEKTDTRNEEVAKAKDEMLSIIKEMYPNLDNFEELSSKALNGQLAIGMPEEMLSIIFASEKGANQKENVKEGKVIVKKEYGYLGENQRGSAKYKKEVTIENGLVSQWKDIN